MTNAMNDEQFEDLKQFVANTVSQSETRVRDDLGTQLAAGFAGVGDAIETLGKHIDERTDPQDVRLDDHEQRLTHLEHKAA